MVCPRCQEDKERLGVLSRRDNKTKICSACGVNEAMFDYGLGIAVEYKFITEDEYKVVSHNEKLWLTGLSEKVISLDEEEVAV